MAQLLKIKAQVSSIWAKGCILMTVCVLSDLTWLPLLGVGRKSWYIIIIYLNKMNLFEGCILPWVAALAWWLPHICKVAGSIPIIGCNHLFCATGAQRVLPERKGFRWTQCSPNCRRPKALIGKQAQGSNQRLTAPLNRFNVLDSNTTQRRSFHKPACAGRKYLENWEIRRHGTSIYIN